MLAISGDVFYSFIRHGFHGVADDVSLKLSMFCWLHFKEIVLKLIRISTEMHIPFITTGSINVGWNILLEKT